MVDAPLTWSDAVAEMQGHGHGQQHGWWFGGESGRELVVKHAGQRVEVVSR